MSFSIDKLQEIRDCLVKVAKESAQIILSADPSTSASTSKKNTTDIVTETDKAVENLIATRLIAAYPEYDFVGEETFNPSAGGITSAPTFCVDPIDGTSNFVHGFPSVTTALGLLVDRRPAVGVVFNPFTRELWTAVRGAGALYQRGDDGTPRSLPLPGPPLRGLQHACVGVDWGVDRDGPDFELNARVFGALARSRAAGGRCVRSLRCTGSAAESVCRVAAGQLDAFWECGCFAWDVAAAWCVLAEAGGLLVDALPGEWSPGVDNERFLAVRPAAEGQRELVEEFWGVVGDGRSTYGPQS
ncbi:Metallo-dependent phosphatase [Neofusicoccum parvum]|nr:Metallo-dependent phosphatase [Neofusicoccum parvum]